MGALVVTYTALGGIKAVTWADVQQMTLDPLRTGMAFAMAIYLLPGHVSFGNAVSLAGAAGKLNAVNFHFEWNDRYNVWSGLIGGMFLALAYFVAISRRCSATHRQIHRTSRLSLLFNAMAKIPMQFFILFIGHGVRVFHFCPAPVLFQPVG